MMITNVTNNKKAKDPLQKIIDWWSSWRGMNNIFRCFLLIFNSTKPVFFVLKSSRSATESSCSHFFLFSAAADAMLNFNERLTKNPKDDDGWKKMFYLEKRVKSSSFWPVIEFVLVFYPAWPKSIFELNHHRTKKHVDWVFFLAAYLPTPVECLTIVVSKQS